MTNALIIDRRSNPKSKNLGNRQRFMRRVRERLREAINKEMGDRAISDESGANISISRDGIEEPYFSHDTSTGEYDYILPGNHEYVPGDIIERPEKNGGGRGGAGAGGDSTDEFQFSMSRREYIDFILDDLELPEMVKQSRKTTVTWSHRRAGFSSVGVPTNLNVERTMIAGIGRRIALRQPRLRDIAELEDELADNPDAERQLAIEETIAELRRRADAVAFLDNVDLRYNNHVKVARPNTQAVMFLLMDVSGSMSEHHKSLAKRFFVLLYLFLTRKYPTLDVVFIRHTHVAEVVDEETFFYDQQSGGTYVSTAYVALRQEIDSRYPPADWNIYVAQASDGDNSGSDNERSAQTISRLLPDIQYMTYLEVKTDSEWSYAGTRPTELWETLDGVRQNHANLVCASVHTEQQIVPVFREFFAPAKAVAA